MSGSDTFHTVLMYSALGVSVAASLFGFAVLWGRFSEGEVPSKVYSWYSPLVVISSAVSLFMDDVRVVVFFSLAFAYGLAAGMLSLLEFSQNISNAAYSAIYAVVGSVLSIVAVLRWPWDRWLSWAALSAVALSVGLIALIPSVRHERLITTLGAVIMAGLGALEMIDFINDPFGLNFVWASRPAWFPFALTLTFLVTVVAIPEFAVGVAGLGVTCFWCSFELWCWFEFQNFRNPIFEPQWHMVTALLAFMLGYAIFAGQKMFIPKKPEVIGPFRQSG